MNRQFLKEWAREEILAFIDQGIKDRAESYDGLTVEDAAILKMQRNRVAKLFGLPHA